MTSATTTLPLDIGALAAGAPLPSLGGAVPTDTPAEGFAALMDDATASAELAEPTPTLVATRSDAGPALPSCGLLCSAPSALPPAVLPPITPRLPEVARLGNADATSAESTSDPAAAGQEGVVDGSGEEAGDSELVPNEAACAQQAALALVLPRVPLAVPLPPAATPALSAGPKTEASGRAETVKASPGTSAPAAPALALVDPAKPLPAGMDPTGPTPTHAVAPGSGRAETAVDRGASSAALPEALLGESATRSESRVRSAAQPALPVSVLEPALPLAAAPAPEVAAADGDAPQPALPSPVKPLSKPQLAEATTATGKASTLPVSVHPEVQSRTELPIHQGVIPTDANPVVLGRALPGAVTTTASLELALRAGLASESLPLPARAARVVPPKPSLEAVDRTGTTGAEQVWRMKTAAKAAQKDSWSVKDLPVTPVDEVEPLAWSAPPVQPEVSRLHLDKNGVLSLEIKAWEWVNSHPVTEAAVEVAATEEPSALAGSQLTEKVDQLITREVLVVRRLKADSLTVVLKPDSQTELVLQLKQQQGEVEAFVRCNTPAFDRLQKDWGQLQESLAQQNVRLLPLRENPAAEVRPAAAPTSQDSSQDTASRREHPSHSPSRRLEEELAADAPRSSASKPRPARARRVAQGWETWA